MCPIGHSRYERGIIGPIGKLLPKNGMLGPKGRSSPARASWLERISCTKRKSLSRKDVHGTKGYLWSERIFVA